MADTTALERLEELRARVEGAAGPSREIDCALACVLDGFWAQLTDYPCRDGAIWRVDFCRVDEHGGRISPGHGGDQMVRPYSDSLDAALGLVERVLPDYDIDLKVRRQEPCTAFLWKDGTWIGGVNASAPTSPYALIQAALSALIEKEKASS